MLDEMAVEFLKSPTRETRELPLGIASISSLPSILAQATNLEPSETTSSSASIDIVPQQSMVTEEILVSERESDSIVLDSRKLSTVPKYNLIGLNESVQVSEVLTEELPEETSHTKPTTHSAKTKLIPTQPLQITESITHDSLSDLHTHTELPSSARIELFTHDAKIVQETISNLSEESLTLPQAPVSSKAFPTVLSRESIEVTEVNKIEKEQDFDSQIKLPSVTPKYHILPSESIQTSETIAEDSPSKFYPELAVPTESARKVFIEQKSYTTHVLNAPEKEDIYVPGRLPPQQKADVLLSTTESLQISEQSTQEQESELAAEARPTTYKAVDSVTTLEGLTTETVNEAFSTRPFEAEAYETRTATVDFREQTTVSISKVDSNEAESDLAPFTLAPSAKASTSLSTLSIGESVEPFVHEKETLHQGVPKPYEATAETTLEPIENISVTEVETADTAGRFSPEVMERTEMATPAFTLQQSHAVSAVLTNEKETDFIGKIDQKPVYAATQLDVQHQLEVTTHETSERETIFTTPQMPADQLAKTVPTDMLKSVLIQETTTNLSTTDLPQPTHETSAAQVRTDELEEKIIAETTIYEGTQDYEKPIQPEQKTADTSLQPNTELVVTEVVTEQREREGFDVQDLAKDYKAQQVPTHSLKSVLIEETLISDSLDQVQETPHLTTSAAVKDDRFEETVVSEAMVLEGTEHYTTPDAPAMKSVDTKTEPLEGLVVTEVVTEVREQEGVKAADIAKDYVAKTSATDALKSVLIEEVQISNTTGQLSEPDVQTSAATVNRDELEQTTVMQALILEGLNKLLEDTTPEMKTAEALLSPNRELTITEVIAEQKEREGFDVHEIAKDYVAKQTPAHTLKSVIVETTEATDSVGDVTKLQMVESSATVKTDQFEEKIISETMVLEETGRHEEQEFNARQAEPSLLPISELVVTEVVAEQREKEGYDVREIAKDHTAFVVPSHALKSVLVQEVLTSDTVDQVSQVVPQSGSATVKSDQLEQKTISEVVAYEGVEQVPEEQKPTERTADKVVQLVNELLVTEVSPEEKEREGFSAAELAKDHVAKTVPTDTLKSVTVEEILTAEDSERFEQIETATTTASVRSDQHEQTTVQETIIYEDTERYIESSKPTEKSAETVVMPISELIITEVHPEQKEREGYDVVEMAKDNIAKTVPSHTLKSVTVEEVLLTEREEQLTKPKTITSIAAMKSDELEQKTISETMVYEGSQLLPEDEHPSMKTASPAYQPNTEVVVTEVVPEQKEREGFSVEEIAKDYVATAVPSHTLKSVLVQETLSSENVDEFAKVSTATSSAVFKDDKFEETSVQETVVLESIAKYDEQARPDQKTADTIVTPISELVVTEIIAEQKEKEGYSVEDIAKDHTAKVVPSDALKSVTVQEVQPVDVLGRVLDTSVDSKTATIKEEELEQTTTSETYIYEGLRQYSEEKPSERVAAPNVEAISELVVTEVFAEQKEKEGYDVKDIASNYVAKEVPSHTLRSVQVEQVLPSDDVGHIPDHETQTSHARPIGSEIEQKVISENVVLENIDTMPEEIQPEQKSAEASFQPNTELVVTEVVSEQKEKEGFSVEDIASQYVAKSVPAHSLQSIIVEEVITSNATGDVTTDEKSLSTAQIREDEHEQTTVTQQVILENFEQMERSVQPEQKAAVPSMQPNEELIVTEIVSEQKETEGYSVEEISKNYSAKQVPSDTMKSVTVEEVQLVDTTGSIEVPETVSTTATVRKNEFEETTVSETMVFEVLGKQMEKITPEHKTADATLLPNTELVVTEVVSEQKEKEGYDVHDIAKDYAAKPVTEGLMRSLIVEEVQPTDRLGDVTQVTEEQLATVKKDQFDETTEIETMVYEAIGGIKESIQPDSKTAEVLVQPNAEIIVTEVVSEQREKEGYDIKEIAKDYVAQAKPGKMLKSVIVEQVEVAEDVSKISLQEHMEHSATASKDTLEQTIVTETLAYENITQQEQASLPDQRTAEPSLESMSGITITEVITEQMAKEGIHITEMDQQKAKQVPSDVLKSLTVEQVQPLIDAAEVTPVGSKPSKASVKTDELSVTSVTETTTFEGIKEYEGKIEFDWHTAKLVPAEVFKSLSIEQVQPFLLTGNVPEEMLKPLSVVVRTDEHEQVVASETTVFECIKDFIEKIDQEEHFARPMTGDILRSLTVEQVVSLQHTGEVDKFIAKATSALIKSDEREQTTVTESVIYEALKEYFGKLEIEGQTAKLIPSDVLKSLTVQQVQPLDELHEVPLDQKLTSQAITKTDELEEIVTVEPTIYEGLKEYDGKLILDEHLAKQVLPSEQKSLSVEQTETFIGIGEVKMETSKVSEAIIRTDEFEQKVISETTIYEGIQEGPLRTAIDERYATPAVDGLKLPIKSEVGTTDAVEDLSIQMKMQEDSATSVIVEHIIASQTQTLTHDSLGQLKAPEEIDSKHAIPQVSDLHVPSQLETVASEALEQLRQPQDALERSATVNISDFIVPLQSHTITSADTTAPFEEIAEPRKFATKSIQDGLRAAECMEVSSNELNDITEPTEAPHGQASVSFTTNIIANVMETTTHENVDNITVHREPTERFAQLTQSMFDMYEESMPLIREDADTQDHTSPIFVTTFETCTDDKQTYIKSKNKKLIKSQGMIVEEILSDEDVTPIPQFPTRVHIEEIDEQIVTEDSSTPYSIQTEPEETATISQEPVSKHKLSKKKQIHTLIQEQVEDLPLEDVETIPTVEQETTDVLVQKSKRRVVKKKKVDTRVEGEETVITEEESVEPFQIETITEAMGVESQVPVILQEHELVDAPVVERLPEDVQVTERITEDGERKTSVIKKRTIKKKSMGKEELIEVVTIQEEDKAPETTITITEEEIPEGPITHEEKPKPKRKKVKKIKPVDDTDDIIERLLNLEVKKTELEQYEKVDVEFTKKPKPVEEFTVEEHPQTEEMVQTKQGEVTKQVVKKKVIKKRVGPKVEVTEIVTTQQEGKEPEITETVTEEFAEPFEAQPQIYEEASLVEEIPEQVEVKQTVLESGEVVTEVIKKRVSKKSVKKMMPKTVEMSEDEIDELLIIPAQPEQIMIEELPEKIDVVETITTEGKTKKHVTKTKVIKKRTGDKVEEVQVVTIQEDDKPAETTITLSEEAIPVEPTGTDIQPTEKQKPKKKKVKTIKKSGDDTDDIIEKLLNLEVKKTELETYEKIDIEPRRRSKQVEEFIIEPVEPEQAVIEELPVQHVMKEVTTIVEKPKKVVTKKQIVKRKVGDKEEVTEVVTVQEDDKPAETTVTVMESVQPYDGEQVPQEVAIVEDVPQMKKIKTKIVKTKSKDAQEVSQEIPLEETISFEPQPREQMQMVIEEMPEKVEIIETITEEGKPRKQSKKTKVIKKKVGDTVEEVLITTVQEDDKPAETTITIVEEVSEPAPIEESDQPQDKPKTKKKKVKTVKKTTDDMEDIIERLLNLEVKKTELEKYERIDVEFKPRTRRLEETSVEEFPETVTIQHTEDGTETKQVTKRKLIKKKVGKKEQTTEVVTVQTEGAEPTTTVTVTEEELPYEQPEEFIVEQVPAETAVVEELPEEIKVTEIITEVGKPKKQVTKKRTLKKRIGDKEELVEVVTVQEDGKEPETTVTITETEPEPEVPATVEPMPVEQTLQDIKPVEKPKPKKKKVKTIKTSEAADDIIEKLLNLEVKKTELEQYERIDVEFKKKPKLTTEISVERPKAGVAEVMDVEEAPLKVKTVRKPKEKKVKETVTEEVVELLPVKPIVEEPKELEEQEVEYTEQLIPTVVEEITEEETSPDGTKQVIIKKKIIRKKISKGKGEPEAEIPTEEREELLPSSIVEIEETVPVEELPEEETKEFVFVKPEQQEAVIEEYTFETQTYEEKSLKQLQQLQKESIEPEQETEAKKVIKKIKKKVKKTGKSEEDEALERLLNLEVEKTELETYEKIELDAKPKPEKPKLKLEPIKIERKEQKPTKLKITEPEEQPQMIKLRKVKVPGKKEIEEVVVPKVLLKSRIIKVEYPPAVQFPQISQLVTKQGVGELTRADEEEEKIKMKKIKKIKTTKRDKLELEKVDLPEYEEEQPEEEQTPEEKEKYQRKPKEKTEEETEVKILKLGKGKVKKDEPVEESVTLKKTPKKPKEDVEEETVSVKKPKQKPESVEGDKKQKHVQKPSFTPTDIPDVEVEIEEYRQPSPVPDEPEDETPQKKKRPKKPKEPQEEEEKERPLIMGKGKKPEETPEEDVKFRIPTSKKPEEEGDQIKLKPIPKPVTDAEDTEKQADRDLGLPTPADKPDQPEQESITVQIKKKRVVKKKSSKEKPDEEPTEEAVFEEPTPQTAEIEQATEETPQIKKPTKEPAVEWEKPKEADKEPQSQAVVEHLPEQVEMKEVITAEGEQQMQITIKKVIKKKRQGKEEVIEVVTVQTGDKAPETTVTVSEISPEESTLETPKEPKVRVKKVKVPSKKDDLDEIVQRLLDQEITKTELEQYEKFDFEITKKPKEEQQQQVEITKKTTAKKAKPKDIKQHETLSLQETPTDTSDTLELTPIEAQTPDTLHTTIIEEKPRISADTIELKEDVFETSEFVAERPATEEVSPVEIQDVTVKPMVQRKPLLEAAPKEEAFEQLVEEVSEVPVAPRDEVQITATDIPSAAIEKPLVSKAFLEAAPKEEAFEQLVEEVSEVPVAPRDEVQIAATDIPSAATEKPLISKAFLEAAPKEEAFEQTLEETSAAPELPMDKFEIQAVEVPDLITEKPAVQKKPLLEAAPKEELFEQLVEETSDATALQMEQVQLSATDILNAATEKPTIQARPTLEAAAKQELLEQEIEETDNVPSLSMDEMLPHAVDVADQATEKPYIHGKPQLEAAPIEEQMDLSIEEADTVTSLSMDEVQVAPTEESLAAPAEQVQVTPQVDVQVAPEPAKKVKKVTKVKKTKKSIDDDEELQRLLNLEIEKTELEVYEKVDLDAKEKIKPEKGEPVKLEPIKIERKEQKPTKLEITDTPEPQTIKLRKTVLPEKKEIEEVTVPKVLLKSRVVQVEYPPEAQKPQIVELDTKQGVGELSRIEEEEDERKVKKIKKVKVIKKEKTELETLDIEKYEKEPTVKEEQEEDKPKYQRQVKEKPVEETEDRTLVLGKGKLKKEEDEIEEVKLKKTPTRPKEEEQVEEVIKKKKEEKPTEDETVKKQKHVERPTFTPTDIPDVETELEPYEKPAPEPKEKPVKEPKKPKVPKEPKAPEVPEEPEHKIVLGKGKLPEPEPEPEVKFRIAPGKKPDEEPEEIKLKPFKKPSPEKEPTERDADRDMALPKPKEYPEEPEAEITIKKKKKKVPKEPEAPSAVEEIPEPAPLPEEPVKPIEIPQEEPKVEEPAPVEEVKKPKELPVEQPTEKVTPKLEEETTEDIAAPVVITDKPTEVETEPLQKPEVTQPEVREVKEEKKKVVKKVKKPKAKPEDDDELQRLLNLEVEKTPLEQYEKVELEPKEKEKPAPEVKPVEVPKPKEEVVEPEPKPEPVVQKAKIVEQEPIPEHVAKETAEEKPVVEEAVPSEVKVELASVEEGKPVEVKQDIPAPVVEEQPIEPEPVKKPKEKKVVKVVKKPKKASLEDDEQLQKLLNLEIEKTELEKYEKVDIDITKKPKQVEEVVIEQKPEEPKVEEVPEEVVFKPKPKPVIKPVEEEVEVDFKLQRKPRLPEQPQEVEESITLKPTPQKPEETVSVERIIKIEVEREEPVTIEEADELTIQREEIQTIEPLVEEPVEEEIVPEEVVPIQPIQEEISEAQPLIEDAVLELPSEETPEVVESVPIQPIVEEPTPVIPLRKVSLKPVPKPEVKEEKPKEKPKKKIVVVKKKKASLDDDAELQRLLNLEVEKTELEMYERTDVDFKKREKMKITVQPQPQRAVESTIEEEETIQLKPRKRSVKPSVETIEETEVAFKLKPKKKPEEQVEDATVTLRKQKPSADEETAVEQIIKLRPVAQKPEEVEEVEESIKLKAKPQPYVTDEAEASLKIVKEASPEEKPKKKVVKKKKEDDVDEVTRKLLEMDVPKTELEKYEKIDVDFTKKQKETVEKEAPAPEEVVEQVVIRKQRPRPKPAFRREVLDEEEVRIKKIKKVRQPRPVFKDIEPSTVTFQPRRVKHIEDIEQEFKIQLDSYAREEISMTGRVKLPAPYSYGEETGEAHITIIKEVNEDDEVVYEVIYDDSEVDVEEDEYDRYEEDAESVVLELRKRRQKLESLIVHQEEEISIDLTRRKSQVTHEEESFTLKQQKKSLATYSEETASLKIVREEEANDMYCIQPVEAENEEAIHLVEGEKVFVIDRSNPEWWFVKRSWSEERGFVRKDLLMDAVTYPQYVQKTLNEKIDKLPVFEKPAPSEKPQAPKIIEKLQPISTQDGYTIQFECKVEGYPRPQITWFRQTAVIKSSQDFQIYYDDDNVATLIIREVFPEDAGTFTCVAKNIAGFAASTTELSVDSFTSDHGSEVATLSRKSMSRESSLADILEGIPPTFSRKPKAQYVDAGSDVLLECRLVAIPEPDIHWFYNGTEITTKDNIEVVVESDMHMYCTLVQIQNIDKSQEGTYQVVARNREGESALDITVKVKTGVLEPPQILEPLKSMSIRQGDTVMLSTQIVGNPTPEVQWFKNGEILKLPTQVDKNMYTVTLLSPTHDNAGEYSVKAKNAAGTVQTTAFLTVDESNFGNPQAPLFLERFEEQSVPQGGTIKLPAKVSGNPVPEILWLRNNNTLLTSKKVKQAYDGQNIELTISNADSEQDSGNYKCIASNTVGKASHGARVTVEVDKVTFVKKLKKTVTVEESKSVTLECETSHTVSTKWFHNGKEMSGMDHRVIVQEGKVHKVVIKNPTIKDTGVYQCTVKDQATECNLTVLEAKPEFLRKMEDVETKEKQNAVLEVEITSETADVVWYKEGKKIVEEKGKYEFSKKGKTRSLLVRSTSVHDEGEYICALADQECSAEVVVIELPPEIITPLKDVTVARGENAVFEIELTKGDALVRWYRDNTELSFNGHYQLTIDGKRQTLKIMKTVDEDTGVYKCVVGDQLSTAKLTVERPLVDFVKRLPDVTITTKETDAVFIVELSESAEVTWYKNNKKIKASSKYELVAEKNVRKLIVKNATEDDEDEYTCTIANVKTSSKLKVEVIKVAPTIFDDGSRTYTIRKEDDVTFNVKFNATPKPDAEWYVNEKLVIPSPRFVSKVGEETASLTIRKVVESDAGDYTVRLVNECGDASASFTLIVKKQPGAPDAPEATRITDDSITLFWKSPEDNGNSTITEYILEYQEKNKTKWTEITSITETTTTVTKLTKNSEYTFRVTAVNEMGKGPASPNSPYYKIAAPIKKEAPVVSEHLKDVHIGLNQTVTLTCIVNGVPTPEVTWYRNGVVLKEKTITYENGAAKYVVTKTTKDTSGTYVCKAVNEVGSVESSCKVVIEEKPTITVDKKQIVQKLRVGDEWTVVANFEGYPVPEIVWYREDEVIESTAEHTIVTISKSSTIVIGTLDRSDSGKYVVEARNSAGSASVELQLKVIDKPSKPEGPIVVKELSPEAVVIEWKPPADDGGLEISQYSIEKCDDTNKNAWIKVADVQKNIKSYCIQKLLDSTQYHFRVIAQNPVGCSEPLESASITVKQVLEPPSPPRGPVETSGMSAHSFTLSWQPSENNGGSKITEYLVEMKESKKKVWKVVGSTSASETSLLIENLTASRGYDFRIYAKNKIGTSEALQTEESIVAGKEITPPSAPRNLRIVNVTSKSIKLEWQQPETNGGSDVTGYVIEKRLTTSQQWTKIKTLDANCLSYCVDNLKEKSELVFRVFAENVIGLSPPATSETVTLKSHATVPSPPTGPLEVRYLGPNINIVEWGIPESDGGAPLEGYNIVIRNVRKTMWMEVGQVSADCQSFNIKDLAEDEEYLIRIIARNEVGNSDPLESEEPYKAQLGAGPEDAHDETTRDFTEPSATNTSSWLREHNMTADIHSYARHTLLRRREYFFKLWINARNLFK